MTNRSDHVGASTLDQRMGYLLVLKTDRRENRFLPGILGLKRETCNQETGSHHCCGFEANPAMRYSESQGFGSTLTPGRPQNGRRVQKNRVCSIITWKLPMT